MLKIKLKMLKNKTKNRILAKKTIIWQSLYRKAAGLMFTKKRRNTAFIFVFGKEQKTSIHMLFVLYPLDIIWLDKNKRVVETKTMQPFTFYWPKKKSRYVVEVNKGIVKKTKTKIGDTIKF